MEDKWNKKNALRILLYTLLYVAASVTPQNYRTRQGESS